MVVFTYYACISVMGLSGQNIVIHGTTPRLQIAAENFQHRELSRDGHHSSHENNLHPA